MEKQNPISIKTKITIVLATIDILIIAIVSYLFDYTYFPGMGKTDGIAYIFGSYLSFFILSYILAWIISKFFISKKEFIHLISFILVTVFIGVSFFNKIIEKRNRTHFASAFQIESTDYKENIDKLKNIPSVQDDVANFIAKFITDNASVIYEMINKKGLSVTLINQEILKSKDTIQKNITDGNKILTGINAENVYEELVLINKNLEDKFANKFMQIINDETVYIKVQEGFQSAMSDNINFIKEAILIKKDILRKEIDLLEFIKQNYNDFSSQTVPMHFNSKNNQIELQNRINNINKSKENLNLAVEQFVSQHNQKMKSVFRKYNYIQ